MTQEQKLQKIIERGSKRGYMVTGEDTQWLAPFLIETKKLENLIFSHPFLQAYFGEEKVDDCGYQVRPMTPQEIQAAYRTGCIYKTESNSCYRQYEVENMQTAWQYHAQQLATTPEEERIDYIYQNYRD